MLEYEYGMFLLADPSGHGLPRIQARMLLLPSMALDGGQSMATMTIIAFSYLTEEFLVFLRNPRVSEIVGP